jgi:hypothetical protein
MAERFPVAGPGTINLEFESTLACSACGGVILEVHRLDPKDVELVERLGFMRIVRSERPLVCAVVAAADRGAVSVGMPETIWAAEDAVGYRPVCCVCGVVVGAQLFAVSGADARLLDAFWVVVERINVCQGGAVCPLEAVVGDQGDDDAGSWS